MSKVQIIPCSGIGKVFGLLARETALHITDILQPDETCTVCLAHLVTGDEDAVVKVKGVPCITIDGCPALCAAKSVEAVGGIIEGQYRVVDEMRNHRGVKAGTATFLTDEGWGVVHAFAEKISAKASEMGKGEDTNA